MTFQTHSTKAVSKLADRLLQYQHYIEGSMVAVFVVGILLKDPELSPVLMQVALGTLSFLYVIMALRKVGLETKPQLYTNQVLSLAFSIGVMGILYRLMHLPGANNMCYISLGIMGVGAIVMVVLRIKLKSPKKWVIHNLVRIGVIGGAILELYLF